MDSPSSDLEDNEPFLGVKDEWPDRNAAMTYSSRSKLRGWLKAAMISISALFVFSLGAYTSLMFSNIRRGEVYETGFATEFEPSWPYIKLEKRQFTGSIMFDDIGNPYSSIGNDQPNYVGEPNEAIDAAWKDILEGYTTMYITDKEESRFDPSGEYSGEAGKGFKISLSLIHGLHCLNVLRMYIDREHYVNLFDRPGVVTTRLHVDHCIDFLRQSLQCYGDLTPIPMRWWESAGRYYADSGTSHTCRNFDDIKSWVGQRHNGSLAVFIDNENIV